MKETTLYSYHISYLGILYKCGKQEDLLHAIEKKEISLHTYIKHLGILVSIHKNYKDIFVVIDAFTKCVWAKSTEVILKLEN